MKRWKGVLLIAAAALCAGTASVATGTIIFQIGNHPQANEENVLFNQPGLISGPALTVTGKTNQTGFIVAFTGLENLITPSAGQARVEAQDGAFTNLSIGLPGGFFTDLIFNLNSTLFTSGIATITVHQVVGPNAVFLLPIGNGENFLTILAVAGEFITSVDIASSINLSYADIRQTRISGATNGRLVPEPATVLLLGIGLAGLGFYRRRKLR